MKKTVPVLAAMLLVAACVMPPAGPAPETPEIEYRNATAAAKEKKYQEAVNAYNKIITDSPDSSVAADALYQLAYLRTLYDNPHRDYALALQDFEEYIKRYPTHERLQEAENWRTILKTILDLRKDNERLSSNIEKLKKLDIRHEERRKN